MFFSEKRRSRSEKGEEIAPSCGGKEYANLKGAAAFG